ncbi:MAG: hypothetical protein JW934_17455 [Anaerolineae bacterium]|nr:hypothetical protein [Anaerolineae bacterium]
MKKIKSTKQLLITLIAGFVPIAICFTVGWPIAGWIFFLLTFFALCFSVVSRLYTLVFSLFAIALISVVCGLVVDRLVFADVGSLAGWRPIIAGATGFVVGIVAVVGFWLPVLYVNARWLMDSSKSLGVSTGQMMGFLFSRVFQTGQHFISVDDGGVVFDNTNGLLSGLGGPGILLVAPGHAVALQNAGRFTRIAEPGIHKLQQFETFMQPRETKGIIDLRPQYAGDWAEEVRTKDGIPLKTKVGMFFQLEPTRITDQRPESRYEGGDATSRVIGGPEYPVYEAIIKKSLLNIPRGGFKTGWFPSDPIHALRDVVATYTLDELFSVKVPEGAEGAEKPDPNWRTIRKIEETVNSRFNPSSGGVWFKGLDIREIRMPPEIEARMVEEWTEAKQFQSRVAEARANRDVMIVESEGRARALERMEMARSRAWEAASEMMVKLMEALDKAGHKREAWDFVNVIRQLTVWAGHDDTVAMNYIEAMQRIVDSEGSKHVFLQPTGFVTNPLFEPRPSLADSTKSGKSDVKMVSGGHTMNGQTLVDDESADDDG